MFIRILHDAEFYNPNFINHYEKFNRRQTFYPGTDDSPGPGRKSIRNVCKRS